MKTLFHWADNSRNLVHTFSAGRETRAHPSHHRRAASGRSKVSSNGRSATVPDPRANTSSHSEKSGGHSSAPSIGKSKNTQQALHLLPAAGFWGSVVTGGVMDSSNPLMGEMLQSHALELKRPSSVSTLFPKQLYLGAWCKPGKKSLHLICFVLLFYAIFAPCFSRFPLFTYTPGKILQKDPNFSWKLKLEKFSS